jgi:hypothetical protein
MPEIARFYGIIIKLFFSDHPPPHFHVVYGEYNALFDIETLDMIEGDLPNRAKSWLSNGQHVIKPNCWKCGQHNNFINCHLWSNSDDLP